MTRVKCIWVSDSDSVLTQMHLSLNTTRQEPFHTSMLMCVYTYHTDKSLLFPLLWFCITCVCMSSLTPLLSSVKAVETSLPVDSMTEELKGVHYLLATQGVETSLEFVMASLRYTYRACLSSTDKSGSSHID